MRALRDMNLPKFVFEDVPLFLGLISDLFPGLDCPRVRYPNFNDAVEQTLWTLKPWVWLNFMVFWTLTLETGLMVQGCGCSLGREYELGDGWQQAPHSSRRRTDSFRVTVPCCLRFVWIFSCSAKQLWENNVGKLHRHRLEICSMLPPLLFPAVGWFSLIPKTCDTPHTGRDGWTTDLAGYEKNAYTLYIIIVLAYKWWWFF